MAADSKPPDIEASGLLDGLQGRARHERAELIEWLLASGFDVDQIRSEFSPMLLPAIRLIGGDGGLVSPREVSESSGVSLELLQRLHRAAGLVGAEDPDARLQSKADAESVLGAARLVDLGLDPQQVGLIVRLLMHGLTGAAVSMRQAALQASLHPGATELELARALEVLTQHAEPILGPMVDALLRLALRHSVETEAINAVERSAGTLPGARQVGVAFADLVGFTRLGEGVPPEDLEHLVNRLSVLARDVVEHPVRLIKTIGDEVMFVSTDTVALLRAALALLAAVEKDRDLPQLRVGVASGWAV